MATAAKLIAKLALALVLSPFFAVYGVVVLAQGVLGFFRFVRSARLATVTEIRCPNGHPNRTSGRFACGSCRAEYHGWVGRCAVCGAGAAWFPCEVCGVGIPLPWERR